jgi:hypothetical protein
MNRKIFSILSILIITVIAFVATGQEWDASGLTQQELRQKFQLLKSQYEQEAREKLLHIKIASHYERISDGAEISRSIDEVANIFKETNTELIFRSFWRWMPVPESSNDMINGGPADLIRKAAKAGYTYQQYKDAASKIKEKTPNMILVGAISAQRVNKAEINPVTREVLGQDKTWEMAFDPGKWKLDVSKEETQCKMTKSWHWIDPKVAYSSGYNFKNAAAYFPDITNEQYQKLLLSLAEKQIYSGADAIWIDMLFYQASFIADNTKNPNHPAVKAAFEAAAKIVDDIHNYGYSKGKYVYVGTWWTFTDLPYTPPNVDFVTATPTSEEISAKTINEAEWLSTHEKIIAQMGDIPMFIFIDYGNDGLPLAVFSQTLTPEQQNQFLRDADAFFTNNGMVFVYPIHGGFMGQSATKLAFDNKNYDSLAFDTYGTIKDLAAQKATGQ